MFDLFNEKRLILDFDGKVEIVENFFEEDKAMSYFHTLQEMVNWRQDNITMFNKTHPIPRLQAWYADEGIGYNYSKIELVHNSWFKELLEMKQSVETECNHKFNSVLINQYRDGSDYAAWHSDDEKELGVNPLIASLSLGESRIFHLKHKTDKGEEVLKLELPHNSLLIMSGKLQHCWKHQLAKTSRSINKRINLTFRRIIK